MTVYNLNDLRLNAKSVFERRLWEKTLDMGDCWEFQGRRDQLGYGHVYVETKTKFAHRYSYSVTKGPIADGLVVMHICDTPPCVRPDHLKLGTVADNNRDCKEKGRMRNGGVDRTHCSKGHPFEGDNLHITPQGHRVCIECRRAAFRKHYNAYRSAAARAARAAAASQ